MAIIFQKTTTAAVVVLSATAFTVDAHGLNDDVYRGAAYVQSMHGHSSERTRIFHCELPHWSRPPCVPKIYLVKLSPRKISCFRIPPDPKGK